tara:strand:- start:4642 stop:5427 length:786 start_codon:yes stop_codon:yes gene_type:complete
MSVSVTSLVQPYPVNRLANTATITVTGNETGGGSEYVRLKVNGHLCANIDLSDGKTAAETVTLIVASVVGDTGTTAEDTSPEGSSQLTITSTDGSSVSLSIMSNTSAEQTYTIDSAVEQMKAYADEETLSMTVPGDGLRLPQCDRLRMVVTYKNSSGSTAAATFTPMVYDNISGQWTRALVEYGTISGTDGGGADASKFNQDFPDVNIPTQGYGAATVASKDATTRSVVFSNHGYDRVGVNTGGIDASCLVDVWIYGVNDQ